ncbi:hypothetical protein [Pontibacter sp. BAB1700]|uniref:hypothetical protein n=1 Tax=Pontibacter sp. BAB1700 TaxID=1144253 RepID=UPI00026BC20D|nr:hypothetical protein [Pontibacter sp. BAB1700]EJF08072.1 hypothetical protein O71_23061 [Pontibacter sp. BAB1700]
MALAQASCPPGLAHHFGLDEKVAGSYSDYVTNASANCAVCPEPASSRFAGGQRFNGSGTGLEFTPSKTSNGDPTLVLP